MGTLGPGLLDLTSTLGGTGTTDLFGSAAGAGALGGATLPLTLLLALIPALFGQNRGQRDMTSLIKYLKPSQPMYMSPNLPRVDEATLKAVMNQMSRSGGGWGWPSGT